MRLGTDNLSLKTLSHEVFTLHLWVHLESDCSYNKRIRLKMCFIDGTFNYVHDIFTGRLCEQSFSEDYSVSAGMLNTDKSLNCFCQYF